MIDALAIANLAAPRAPARTAAREDESFSYALAAAALEAKAGAALKIHGANGDAEVTAPNAARDGSTERGVATSAERGAPPNAASAPSTGAALTRSAGEQAPATLNTERAAPASLPNMAPSPVVAAAPIAPVINAPAPLAPRLETAPPRELQAARANAEARVKPQTAPRAPAPAAPQEFARLLASRLDSGATAFDLRLDPPELGRVAAKLTLGEERAILTLAFDNQTTLDLFRRDEAALREMLAQSGFDLGGGDLAFTLHERAQEEAPAPSVIAARVSASPTLASAASPRGLIDLIA